ncbi:hypothetical protein DSO57_1000112 [Entomophthora muscae]|uniref:Uncharacterized protein n=1 Tax=Entomophthora muscae TaxID=34485 RepID=A0ACC2SMA4_9FUNG|nr:hypothetical protein DSO57_1000112 [Entomophthora muscae]
MFLALLTVPVALWALKVVHSIWFSQLRHIPSPLVFQAFPIYFKFIMARGQGPVVLHRYHELYGTVFRVGWSTVIFVDGHAASAIYGSYHFTKGSLYDGFGFFGSNIFSMKSRETHAQRKKLIAPAYTRASLMLVQERVIEVGVRGLKEALEESTVNLYDFIRFALWDVTADISLGSSLGMLKGNNRQVIGWVASLLQYSIACSMFPFLRPFKPKCIAALDKLQHSIIQKYINARKLKDHASTRNLDRFYDQPQLTYKDIYAEAHMMLVAGTDTVSNSLSTFFYLLLKHPSAHKKLVHEIQAITPSGEFLDYHEVKDLVYLEAALREALRLLPVAAVPLLRETPKHGRDICGYFIPEKVPLSTSTNNQTTVAVSLYSLHRSPNLWEDACSYIPERWIANSAIINHSNFLPFSLGPRGCIGKE